MIKGILQQEDITLLNIHALCPGWVPQLVGALSRAPERLWVWYPVGEHKGGNQSLFLSHINVSLSLSL